jgi:hypothetical protein
MVGVMVLLHCGGEDLMTIQFVLSDCVEQAMAQAVYDNVMLKPAEASFRQGWLEAMTGQTRPVSELWDG